MMTYKDIKRLKSDYGISYNECAKWIGITGSAISLQISLHDEDDAIAPYWELKIQKKVKMLEALVNGSFSG